MGSDLLCPADDQTGANRAQGNGCDVGANESAFSESPFTPTPNLITVTAFNDDLTAGDTDCTLREAVNNANSDSDTTSGDCAAGSGWDTIVLSTGTYSLTIPSTDEDLNLDGDLDIITGSLTIQGAGDTLTIIDAVQDDRVIEHSYRNTLPVALFLHDLTLTNGTAEQNGGCLRAEAGLTILANTVVSQCTLTGTGSSIEGGGIYSYFSAVTLVDSTVKLNVANGKRSDGGGIYNGNGPVSLYDSLVYSNTAGQGGGVYIDHTHLLLDNSDILSNTAEGDDGGGYNGYEAGLVMRNDSLVAYNVLTDTNSDGGGLFLYSGGVIADSTISHNSSASNGGGIYSDNGGVWMDNSQVEDNQSAGDGGGMYLYTGGVIEDSTFEGNRSGSYGGGLFAYLQALIRDTRFYSNTAEYGGGLSNDEGGVAIFNSDFRWNTATSEGGGIYVDDIGMLLVQSTVSDNSADDSGGGIYAYDQLLIYESTISHNTAITSGGGIYNDVLVALVNSTLSENSAGTGGGVYNNSGKTFYAAYSTIAANTATGNGGGVYNLGVHVLESSILAGNSANGSTSDATADCDAASPFTFSGYSLFGDGTGCAATGLSDITVTPANIFTTVLGPLADNGGPLTASGDPAWTHALLVSSPAINGGYSLFCPLTDQRGVARPVGLWCDIGAVESPFGHLIYLPVVTK